MRGRKGLVQIDVHGVDAEVAGRTRPTMALKLAPSAIDQPARGVDRVADRLHLRLEQAASVGVGDHHRRNVGTKPRLERRKVDAAALVAGIFSTL